MSFQVNFYQFRKDRYSTARPSGSGKAADCVLLESTSILQPTLTVRGLQAPTLYNYCYIPQFKRYYNVEDWTYTRPDWSVTLRVDPFASMREEIGSSTQYVIRSSAEVDKRLIDSTVITKTNPSQVNVPSARGNPFATTLQAGSYVVGIINDDTGAMGSTAYYVFTDGQFRMFSKALMGDPAWAMQGIEEIGAELTKVLFNPFQYVASVVWFPFQISGGSARSSLRYGWWNLPGVSCKTLAQSVRLADASFDIPKHPSAAVYGEWISSSSCSHYTLSWPAIGFIPLDASAMGSCNNLTCQVYTDLITGSGVVAVIADGEIVYEGNSQIGIPIQVSQMASNVVGGLVGGIGGVVSNGLMRNVGGMFESVGNAINDMMPKLSTRGTNGAISAYYFPPALEAQFFEPAPMNNTRNGRPLCREKKISDIPGYIQCEYPKIEFPCYAAEAEEIRSGMSGGFYYE